MKYDLVKTYKAKIYKSIPDEETYITTIKFDAVNLLEAMDILNRMFRFESYIYWEVEELEN